MAEGKLLFLLPKPAFLLLPPRPPPSLSQLGLWPQYLLNDGSSYCGKGQRRRISDRGSSKCKGPGAGMVFLEWRNREEVVRHSQAKVTAPLPCPKEGTRCSSLPILLTSCWGSPEQEPQVWATSVSLAGPRAVEGRESGHGGNMGSIGLQPRPELWRLFCIRWEARGRGEQRGDKTRSWV